MKNPDAPTQTTKDRVVFWSRVMAAVTMSVIFGSVVIGIWETVNL